MGGRAIVARSWVLVLTGLLLLAPAAPTSAATAASTQPAASPAQKPDQLPPLRPPLRHKPVLMNPNGRTDLPLKFEPGVVKFFVKPGRDVRSVLAAHAVSGRLRYWTPPPFSAHDIRAGFDRAFRVEVPVGAEAALVRRMAADTANIEWVQLSWIYNGRGATGDPPNDPSYATSQVTLGWVNAQGAWDRTHGSRNVIIAVVDTGAWGQAPDLCPGKLEGGWDYLNLTDGVTGLAGQLAYDPGTGTLAGHAVVAGASYDSGYVQGHGTGVASIAAACTNNGVGMAGVGYDSGLLPVRVLKADGQWPFAPDGSQPLTLDITIRWLTAQHVHVINMSFDLGTGFDRATQLAIDEAASAGITFVSGAGNFRSDLNASPRYPCAYDNVICVGGVYDAAGDWDGDQTTLSSGFGDQYVDVTAPSIGVFNETCLGQPDGPGRSSCNGINPYGTSLGGVSYAVPIVSGIAALLTSCGYAGTQAVLSLLSATAHSRTQRYDAIAHAWMGYWSRWGLVNAGAAVTAANCGAPSQTFEDNSAAVTYTGTWYEADFTGPSGGTLHYASLVNATVSFSFSGSYVYVVYPTEGDGGLIDVQIDGVHRDTIDMFGSYQMQLSRGYATQTGNHLIQLRDTGTANQWSSGHMAYIDAFIVPSGAIQVAESCVPGTPKCVQTLIEDTNTMIEYNMIGQAAGWYEADFTGPSGGTLHYTTGGGATATLQFSGTSVSVLYAREGDGGYANVYIDGAWVDTLDMGGAYQMQLEKTYPAGIGNHTIQLYATGNANQWSSGHSVYFDAFIVPSLSVPWGGVYPAVSLPSSSWSGTWTTGYDLPTMIDPNNRNVGYRTSSQSFAAVDFHFSGTVVVVYYETTYYGGLIDVAIDGVHVDTIDMDGAPPSVSPPWRVYGASAGNHTLRLTITGTSNVYSNGDAGYVVAFAATATW